MSVPFLHVLCISIKSACKTEQLWAQSRHNNRSDSVLSLKSKLHLRNTLLVVLKMVRLFPSLMVPPICPGLCSGISITCRGSTWKLWDMNTLLVWKQQSLFIMEQTLTTGCFSSGWNSVELASDGQKTKKSNYIYKYLKEETSCFLHLSFSCGNAELRAAQMTTQPLKQRCFQPCSLVQCSFTWCSIICLFTVMGQKRSKNNWTVPSYFCGTLLFGVQCPYMIVQPVAKNPADWEEGKERVLDYLSSKIMLSDW